MKKTISIVFVFIIMIMLLSACVDNNKEIENTNNSTVSVTNSDNKSVQNYTVVVPNVISMNI